MHSHHILPRKAPYLPELHKFKEDLDWQVSLTIEGHACQHDVLYRAFGWNGDKWASDGLKGFVGNENRHQWACKLGGTLGSVTRRAKGLYGLGNCHAIPVIATNKKTGEELFFESCKQAADALGLHANHVSECSRSLSKRKSSGGWKFRRIA